jgi:carbon monoxide dehydrogenase subunit G
MGHMRMTEHLDAPIEKVWDLAIDPMRFPEWNVSLVEVEQVIGPKGHVGTNWHGAVRLMGRRMEGRTEVVESVRPTLQVLKGVGTAGGTFTWTNRFTPSPTGTGTDLESEWEYELPAGFIGGLVDKLFVEKAAERDMRHSTENFKALVEASVKVPQHV